jgi:putative addiction module component (TIGR02574 family)
MNDLSADEVIAAVCCLPLERRVQAAQQLMQSIAEDSGRAAEFDVSDEQVTELDRRMAALDADPSTGLTHDEVWRRLRGRHGA